MPRPEGWHRVRAAALAVLTAGVIAVPGVRAHTVAAVDPPPATTTDAASPDPDVFPRRRAGLWEVRSAAAQSHGLAPTRHCLGEQADQPMHHLDRQVGTRGACTLGAFRRAAGAWVAESVCREGRTRILGQAVASGDFSSEYRIDTVVTYEPPLGGVRRQDKEAVAARWLGPCPSQHRPGDMIVPGMGTLNMIDGTFRADTVTASPPAGRRRRSAADRGAAERDATD